MVYSRAFLRISTLFGYNFDGSLVLCDLFTKLKGSVPDADLGKLAKVYDIKSL